jgi:hypothetical protein
MKRPAVRSGVRLMNCCTAVIEFPAGGPGRMKSPRARKDD